MYDETKFNQSKNKEYFISDDKNIFITRNVKFGYGFFGYLVNRFNIKELKDLRNFNVNLEDEFDDYINKFGWSGNYFSKFGGIEKSFIDLDENGGVNRVYGLRFIEEDDKIDHNDLEYILDNIKELEMLKRTTAKA